MTTIAWDGCTVAAETLAVVSGTRSPGHADKLLRIGNIVYAFSGADAYFRPMVAWHQAGAKPADFPKEMRDEYDSGLSVFEDGKCFRYTTKLPYPDEYQAGSAWGSGTDFAMAIMADGGSAEHAVEIAMKLDPHSGGEVRSIDLSFQNKPQLLLAG